MPIVETITAQSKGIFIPNEAKKQLNEGITTILKNSLSDNAFTELNLQSWFHQHWRNLKKKISGVKVQEAKYRWIKKIGHKFTFLVIEEPHKYSIKIVWCYVENVPHFSCSHQGYTATKIFFRSIDPDDKNIAPYTESIYSLFEYE